MSYETDLDRLASILDEMVREDLTLERALALFEEGVQRLRSATADLERAEAQIKVLVEGQNGTFELTDFRA